MPCCRIAHLQSCRRDSNNATEFRKCGHPVALFSGPVIQAAPPATHQSSMLHAQSPRPTRALQVGLLRFCNPGQMVQILGIPTSSWPALAGACPCCCLLAACAVSNSPILCCADSGYSQYWIMGLHDDANFSQPRGPDSPGQPTFGALPLYRLALMPCRSAAAALQGPVALQIGSWSHALQTTCLMVSSSFLFLTSDIAKLPACLPHMAVLQCK